MPSFQYRLFASTVFGKSRLEETDLRRLALRLGFLTAYPAFEALTHLALALDEVLEPEVARYPIREPWFIVGCPRSGTTFFHRLMALDQESFIAPETWQLVFPSLLQQRAISKMGSLDDRLKLGLRATLSKLEARAFRSSDKIHRIRLTAPEEDDLWLAHIYATGFIGVVFPSAHTDSYLHFDDLPEKTRRQVMDFYQGCVRRLLLEFGQGRRLLSKNPAFSGKLQTLQQTFPDARFIYVVRDPAETIASFYSMIARVSEAQGFSVDYQKFKKKPLLQLVTYLYQHGLETLLNSPPETYAIVRYERLVVEPEAVVREVYSHFNQELPAKFGEKLRVETQNAIAHKSEHHYQLEQFGLTHSLIESTLPLVYDRFGYPRRG